MRFGLLGVVIAVGGLAGCSLSANYDGTLFACDVGSRCPDGYTCVDQRCLPDALPAATCTTAIGAGSSHACAVRSDGTVWCWGSNQSGQLGDGSTDDRTTPVEVVAKPGDPALPAFTQVTGGDRHTCAIASGGAVWCWGDDGAGQLGDNQTSDEHNPVQVMGLTGATAIAAGDGHTCAILAGGAVSCWGDDTAGQLGTTGSSSKLPVMVPGITGATSLAATNDSTCVVAGGIATCWGDNTNGQLGIGANSTKVPPTPMLVPSGATSVAVGRQFACAAVGTTVYCSGANDTSQLGAPSITLGGKTVAASNVPLAIPLAVPIDRVVAGDRFVCAIDNAHGMWCWGANTDYELADGTSSERPIPVRTDYTDALDVAAGVGFVCVRSSDGLHCGGYSSRGQLGDANRITEVAPVVVPGLTNAAALTSGHAHTCVVLDDADKTARCWGRNSDAQLGDGSATDRLQPTPVSGLSHVRKISAGDVHTCAVLDDGGVSCWGSNGLGQLGDGKANNGGDRGVPRRVPSGDGTGDLAGAIDVATGLDHTCALLQGGEIRCWGRNDWGQIGTGTKAVIGMPVTLPVAVKTVAGPVGATAITAGDLQTCAIDGARNVWCWGNDNAGQLGHDVAPDASKDKWSGTPVQVDNLSDVDAIASGGPTTCAHKTDGTVWCWGQGSVTSYSANPMAVGAFATVTVGAAHLCAATLAGAVSCWGTSDAAQLGNGFDSKTGPTPVTGMMDAVALTAGNKHSCALLRDKTVACWGSDRSGQLGDGQTEKTAPVAPQLECLK